MSSEHQSEKKHGAPEIKVKINTADGIRTMSSLDETERPFVMRIPIVEAAESGRWDRNEFTFNLRGAGVAMRHLEYIEYLVMAFSFAPMSLTIREERCRIIAQTPPALLALTILFGHPPDLCPHIQVCMTPEPQEGSRIAFFAAQYCDEVTAYSLDEMWYTFKSDGHENDLWYHVRVTSIENERARHAGGKLSEEKQKMFASATEHIYKLFLACDFNDVSVETMSEPDEPLRFAVQFYLVRKLLDMGRLFTAFKCGKKKTMSWNRPSLANIYDLQIELRPEGQSAEGRPQAIWIRPFRELLA